MMIRVPGLTDHGVATTMYTEHIDLMATLAEAAMGVIVPACPEGEAILTTETCTMGASCTLPSHIRPSGACVGVTDCTDVLCAPC